MFSRKCILSLSGRTRSRTVFFLNSHKHKAIQFQEFCSKVPPDRPTPQHNDDFRHRVEYYMAEMAGASQSRRTILLVIGCGLVCSGGVLVLNRHHVKATVSSETADVISDTIQDERLQVAAGDLSKAIINSLLTDSNVQELAKDWIWKVLCSLETQIADLFVNILNSDVVLTCIRRLLDDLVAYLCANEVVQARVADLLIRAIDLPVARDFSAQWVVDVCTQDWVREQFAGLVNDTLSSPEVTAQASDAAANVVKDPCVQGALRTALISLLEDEQLRDLASNKLWAIATGAIFPNRKHGIQDKSSRIDSEDAVVVSTVISEGETRASSTAQSDSSVSKEQHVGSSNESHLHSSDDVDSSDIRCTPGSSDADVGSVVFESPGVDQLDVHPQSSITDDAPTSLNDSQFPIVIHTDLHSDDTSDGMLEVASEHSTIGTSVVSANAQPSVVIPEEVRSDGCGATSSLGQGASGADATANVCSDVQEDPQPEQQHAIGKTNVSSDASNVSSDSKPAAEWAVEQVSTSIECDLPVQSVLSRVVESVMSFGSSARRFIWKDDMNADADPTATGSNRRPPSSKDQSNGSD